VAELVSGGEVEKGILICGTGCRHEYCANRVKGVRDASWLLSLYTRIQSRRHLDANILGPPAAGVTGKGLAEEIVKSWLDTPLKGADIKKD